MEHKSVEKILEEVGYDVKIGYENVSKAIGFDFSGDVLCSGFGVLPSGEKCKGCADCSKAIAAAEGR